MKTQKSEQENYTPRKVLKLGDGELLLSIIHFKWLELFQKPEKALLGLLGRYLKSVNVTLSYLLTSLLRVKHGVNVSGLILCLLGFCIGVSFNSIYIWKGFTPFVALSIPFFSIWYSIDDLFRFVWVDIESKFLAVYIGVFVIASMIHTVMNWMGLSNPKNSKRGESIVFILISKIFKHTKVNEFLVLMLETLAVLGIGIILIYREIDFYFGLFLIIISANELFLLLVDKSYQIRVRTMLKV